MRGPLSGLKVIELSSFVAAPLGGMTLAQLGADVIRVDPIGGAPDRTRWPLAKSGTSLYWTGLNKGKRSFEADLKSEDGQRLVRDLVASCGPGSAVFLTNAWSKEWASYEQLSTVCPDLIYVQVEGRHDGTPAVDYTVNASAGFPEVTGPETLSGPVNHVLPAWDIACGLYAAVGVLAADRQRAATGRGDRLSVPLEDVALAMAGNLGFLAEAQVNRVTRRRIGNYVYGGFARDFLTADGMRFMIVALTTRHWRDLLRLSSTDRAVAALEQALDVDFGEEGDRYEYREVLAGLFERWFASHPSGDVEAALRASSVLWSRYRTFDEVVRDVGGAPGGDPLMTEIDQPGVGLHLAPRSPLRFDAFLQRAEPAPALGQHTDDILVANLGLDEAERARIVARGVVRGPK